MGKMVQGAQLTHERFLTIDPSKYFFDICQTEHPEAITYEPIKI